MDENSYEKPDGCGSSLQLWVANVCNHNSSFCGPVPIVLLIVVPAAFTAVGRVVSVHLRNYPRLHGCCRNQNSRNLNTIRKHSMQFVKEVVAIDSRAEFCSPVTHCWSILGILILMVLSDCFLWAQSLILKHIWALVHGSYALGLYKCVITILLWSSLTYLILDMPQADRGNHSVSVYHY